MNVELINYTRDAVDLLLYTKETRLSRKAAKAKIAAMSEEEKNAALVYMSRSIPSSWEFVDFVFDIGDVSRAFCAQFERTRTGSYAEQSLRVVDASNFNYLTPPEIEKFKADTDEYAQYHGTMSHIREAYNSLILAGVKKEDARGLLPLNILTSLVAKFNMRTLSELVRKRMKSIRVQGEYRSVVDAMAAEVLRVYPWTVLFLFPADNNFDKTLAFIEKFRAHDEALAIEAMKDIDQARAMLAA